MLRCILALLMLAAATSAAQAGALAYLFNFSAHKAVKTGTYPVRHPMKTVKALKKAAF
jgi:hypothetical protein